MVVACGPAQAISSTGYSIGCRHPNLGVRPNPRNISGIEPGSSALRRRDAAILAERHIYLTTFFATVCGTFHWTLKNFTVPARPAAPARPHQPPSPATTTVLGHQRVLRRDPPTSSTALMVVRAIMPHHHCRTSRSHLRHGPPPFRGLVTSPHLGSSNGY